MQTKFPQFFFSALLTSGLLLSPLTVWAAQVIQVKGAKVLVDLEGAEINTGEEFFLINPETTKKSAIIVIKQVKGGKAIGEIIKGNGAMAGDTLEAKGSSSRPMSAPVAEDLPNNSSRDANYLKTQRDSWGVLGEYLMANMSASFTRTTPTSHTGSSDMKGTGFGFGGFYNYMIARDFSVFFEGSIQQFNASGSTTLADCDNTTSCDVKIMYLSGYASGRYYFTQTKTRIWAGIGAGYLMALSKSSSILNSSQISSNQLVTFSGGADYQLSRKNYALFGLDYGMFPASSSVKASMIILKAGYGWNF